MTARCLQAKGDNLCADTSVILRRVPLATCSNHAPCPESVGFGPIGLPFVLHWFPQCSGKHGYSMRGGAGSCSGTYVGYAANAEIQCSLSGLSAGGLAWGCHSQGGVHLL
eukprot:5555582-Pyramimonas_sp.AAC.1